MAEWSIALPWKGSIRETVSGVRIPLSPQKRTSSEVRADEDRTVGAEEAQEVRKARRPATKWLEGVRAKWAVL